MLGSEDIQKLVDLFATKADLKEAVRNFSTKDDFNNLMTAIDGYTKKADTYFQEMVMLSHKMDSTTRRENRPKIRLLIV